MARITPAYLAICCLLGAAENQSVVEWIRSAAVPLKTVEAGNGFADLQPLKKTIGDARIVALGEATHGTREFFQLKHRMLEFLATEMGFTIFSIEANMPEAYRLNDYVLNGKGDPAQLLRGMYFWTWNTEEVLAMIRWMREFNQSGKGRIEFTGFDMQTPTVALQIVRDFAAASDPDYAATLREAAAVASAGGGASFGVATATFPIAAAAGKKVRYSGYIKTENITRGYAGLWWRADGKTGVAAFNNMSDRGVTGTKDWKQYEIELSIPADATNINFGALLPGDGTAWFDELRIELDGVPYTAKTDFDLDFEGPSAVGFYTSSGTYQAGIDSAVFHSGKQSLRIKYAGPAAAGDPKIAIGKWKDVVEHLTSSRARYLAKGVTPRDAEWALQNARVVLQSLQMKTGEVTRDLSMAGNIKWILDQTPKAKIVLWAHNGHVAKGDMMYETMGSALARMYGDQMAVFGFSFNQGSFQAMKQGSGLKEFTVPPAPEGSLDATLAAAGMPLFALDLRRAPKSGPVAEWLNARHKTRSIGAIYMDDAPYAMMYDGKALVSYDVMLFVEKSSRARPNPVK